MATLPNDALTTRAKVKEYLGITDTTNDLVTDQLIAAVSKYIAEYCGRNTFLAQSYTETYDCYSTRNKIFLRNLPVVSLTSVKYQSGVPSAPVWNTYDANGYLLYQGPGYIQFYAKLPTVPQGLQVVYTAGYLIDWANEFTSTHTLPSDLTLVCTEVVAKLLNTRRSNGISSEQTEGQSITYSGNTKDFEKAHISILSNYKIVRIAR